MNVATVESILLALLVLDAIALVVLILLQQGKGADAGASFGGGGANTMFGSLGATSFLTKATAWLSIGFFVITFGLAYIAKQRSLEVDSAGIPTVENVVEEAELPGELSTEPAPEPGFGDDTSEDDVPEL